VEKSERAAEVKQYAINTNTSCSFFALTSKEPNQIFHMLVDVGQGIVRSIEKGFSDLGFDDSLSSSIIPDALLITHCHEDHIRELPLLAEKAIEKPGRLSVYCTTECRDQILDRYPQLSSMLKNNQLPFTILQPGENFDVGPFSLMPILSYHGENSPPGSVIYSKTSKSKSNSRMGFSLTT
jgi:phosphoribosyl 1,2-cyclic phosphodiesterase